MTTLAQYLKFEKINQAAFAKRIGSTQATVSRLATGAQQPTVSMALKIEAATGGRVSVGDWDAYSAFADRISPPNSKSGVAAE